METEIMQVLCKKYRDELKIHNELRQQLHEMTSTPEQDKKYLTYEEYQYKQTRINILESKVKCQKFYCSGIHDSREILISMGISE